MDLGEGVFEGVLHLGEIVRCGLIAPPDQHVIIPVAAMIGRRDETASRDFAKMQDALKDALTKVHT